MSLDPISIELIRCLASGEWTSGTQLAEQLNLSREAVSKRIRKLAEWQLYIEKQAGRGYRLERPIELLEQETLAQALADHLQQDQCVVLPSTHSSNSWLSENPGIRLCFAEHQSGGRGRRGRNWHSPFGQNIYLSVRVELTSWPEKLAALGLALGVSICQHFNAELNIPLRLKWPNDLYLNGRKCGGMLIEQRGEAHGPCHLIIGIGLNVLMDNAHIDQEWTSLYREGYPQSRRTIALHLAQTVLQETAQLSNEGLSEKLAVFSKFDVFHQQSVNILGQENAVHGRALGIDEWGRLRLQTEQGERLFSVGDVSLRAAT